jgi:pyridoxamine-phosphate oxidase
MADYNTPPSANYHHERRDYQRGSLERGQLHLDPFQQFDEWLQAAIGEGVKDPTAMSLATVDAEGQPHSRIVLLKSMDDKGFVFYTHYNSDKGHELAQQPKAALLFYWPELERQIRIEGAVAKTDAATNQAYFQTRPRDSQLVALVSEQSQPLPGRRTLEQNVQIADSEQGLEVDCPEHWGGYTLHPQRFEFWQGRENRLHDRFRYERTQDQNGHFNQVWSLTRLSP